MKLRAPFALLVLLLAPTVATFAEPSLTVDPFGEVRLFSPSSGSPSSLVLLISGDGGWEDRDVQMADAAAADGAFVAGIDITAYIGRQKNRTWSGCPAKDLENLGALIQEKQQFSKKFRPLLVGYSSGATLAYAALLEEPSAFAGAITFGFCPDLHGARVCEGDNLHYHQAPKNPSTFLLEPASEVDAHWIDLQGDMDKECAPDKIALFVKKVHGAEIMHLKNVGHGFKFPDAWLSTFQEAFRKLRSYATS